MSIRAISPSARGSARAWVWTGCAEVERGPLVPAIRRTFEEPVEKVDTGGRRPRAVVGRPFAAPVRVEPFLRRRGAAKNLEGAARMKGMIRETGADQHRHPDAVDIR